MFHFLDSLTLVDLSNGLRFCVKGKFVKCNALSRQNLNLGVIREGLLNFCIQRIITILDLAMDRYVGNPFGKVFKDVCIEVGKY